MANTDLEVKDKVKTKIQEPSLWSVIIVNDDTTPVSFVEDILINLFKHSIEDAAKITQLVHIQGSGLAGTYCFEIAEAKAVESTNRARSNNFPLQIKLEEIV
jgi:ATP-dependent Clp protease adaptor protein ClpS